jgi:hypothetical protein
MEKRPAGQSDAFCLRDPEDQYETFPFELREGEIVFREREDPQTPPALGDETRIFCSRCAWNGKKSAWE